VDIAQIITWRILSEERINQILASDIILIKGSNSDDRDEVIKDRLNAKAPSVQIKYDLDQTQLEVSLIGFSKDTLDPQDDDPVNCSAMLATLLAGYGKCIVLDITSMSTESLFMILRAFKEIEFDEIIAVYVQPLEYRLERNPALIPDFVLSSEHSPICSIPGFMRISNDLKFMVIVFLGFEGGRFQELREHLLTDGHTEIRPIMPLPSYFAGWHMNGLYQNLDTLKEAERIRELRRVTAWDPFHALNVLESLYISSSKQYQVVVAPLGTKPHTLAAALFVLRHDDVNIMYDHPKVSKQRSMGVGEVRGYILKGLL